MILAGDIGGTKCNLALYEAEHGKLRLVVQRRLASRDYSSVEEVVAEFLRATQAQVAAAAFGAAGPVVGNRVTVTNLGWTIDGAALAKLVGLERALLLNDLEATGYGLEQLAPSELCVLNAGTPAPAANRALIAAGTGLGEAILFWDGARHIVAATEGGHADFAPHTETEIELLRFLKKRFEHVSAETVLSGPGFRLIHEFLEPGAKHPVFDDAESDSAPYITDQALRNGCPVCVRTLEVWIGIYGAEAGNLALHALALGGVYVAGGIAVRILEKLKDGRFVRAFCAKSEFGILLSHIPIYVVLNEDAPLLGAAARAASAV